MKRIVSVSLGSSKRDHRAEAEFLGESFIIERIGTDGDMEKMVSLIKELDGKIDAFGMGGIDLYLIWANRKYIIKDAIRISEAAKLTPMVDGSGLKNTLERRVIKYVDDNIVKLQNKKVLMVSGIDRFGMAEALHALKADITFGDCIFGLNIPIPFKSYNLFGLLAKTLLPVVTKMPFEKLYPVGKEQDVITTNYEKYYREAEIIAGDYLYIKKYMPSKLEGKLIITNTVTTSDVEDLRRRGVSTLITTTPELNGRSFGTNVMEALILSILQKKPEEIQTEDYESMLDKLNFMPRIVYMDNADNREID